MNEYWFCRSGDARSKIKAWRGFYNEERPHTALAWKTSAEFAREHGSQANSQVPKKIGIPTGRWPWNRGSGRCFPPTD
ncbi:integrase core domain-containing protein [Rhodanobacter sp. UC4439_H6]